LDSALLYINMQQNDEAKKQNRDYIRAYYLLQDYGKVISYAHNLKPATIADAWTAYRIGEAYYQNNNADSALPWYKRATEIWPYALDFNNKYGTCLLVLNRLDDAKKVFEFVIGQSPAHISANTNLGY